MSGVGEIISLVGGTALIVFLLVYWFSKTEDRVDLVIRWIGTLALIAYFRYVVAPCFQPLSRASIVGVGLAAVGGLFLAWLWGVPLVDRLSTRFSNFFYWDETPPERRPMYSIAEAKIKQGRYEEAKQELEKILEEFPADYRASLMLAELHADRLQDWEKGLAVLQQWIDSGTGTPQQIAYTLNRMTDWALRYGKDPELARYYLQQIIQCFPDSPQAMAARQRLAHLSHAEQQLQEKPREEPRFRLPASTSSYPTPDKEKEAHLAERRIHELVAQLERFPDDITAREELALCYAHDLGRPDLAAEQIEELLALPHTPLPLRCQWLHRLADFRLQAGDLPQARQALLQILELAPGSSQAEIAERRLRFLHRQAFSTESPTTVHPPLSSSETLPEEKP